MRTAILVPARNEARALPRLFAALSRSPGANAYAVVVIDNGSSDATARVARGLGAEVVSEPRPGYGQACLAGIAWLRRHRRPDALVFLDADDFAAPAQIEKLMEPLRRDTADMVIGERRGVGRGGVRWHARLGNRFVLWVLRRRFGSSVADMGPFRAVRWSTLEALAPDDPNYGWYVQMQARALRSGYRVVGVPVDFERRTVGRSKVSGDPIASIRAGWVMLRTLAVEAFGRAPPGQSRADISS
ncbi:MAG: glycosyltransferase family 2 protein [Gemmatimonadota bacterium]|nr:glycosyltransferase family 2 protein [Gemmatimonadota bacterium]